MPYLPPVVPTTFTTLRKNTRNVFVPAQPGTPGNAGSPAVPAYSGVSTFEVCSYVAYTPSEYAALVVAAGGRIEYTDQGILYIPPNGGIPLPPTTRRVCQMFSTVVSYPARAAIPPTPAIPATPAQNSLDLQLGWNARSHSIRPMAESGVFRFKVAGVQGAVVGLTPAPLSSGFSDLRWAFYVEQGILRIYESGAAVETIGPYTAGTELMLARRFNQIEYYVGGVLERTVPNAEVPMYLGAALYAGGDYIYDASLTEWDAGSGGAILQPVQAFGGDVEYAIGSIVLERVQALGGSDPFSSGEIVLLPVQALGADSSGYGHGAIALMPVEAEGEGLALAPYVVSGAVISLPVIAQGVGTSGGVGNGEVVLLPVTSIGSDYPYSYGAVVSRPVTSYGEDYSLQTEANMISVALALGGTESLAVAVVVFNSDMTTASVIVATPLNLGTVVSAMTATTPYLTQAEITALITSLMSARGINGGGLGGTGGGIEGEGEDADDADNGLSVWVMNMETSGATRYENYNFNSFAKIGETYYGANDAGLFELAGDSDNGANVEAEINFGKLRFGTSARKSMRYCYIGTSSNGQMILKVEADGETYYYELRDHDELQEMQRFEMGRGLRAVYYDFTLKNCDGSAFDLASIEFTPIPLTRRL